MKIIHSVWNGLKRVRKALRSSQLLLQSTTIQGEGTVEVVEQSESSLLFLETGRWNHERVYRSELIWKITGEEIELHRLAHGQLYPLFHFRKFTNELRSTDHFCGSDCYSGQILISEDRLIFNCSVKGAKKQDHYSVIYV